MIAYMCKNCGKFTIAGYINEFNEHFCTETCYKTYCKNHKHEPNMKHIWKLNTSLN